MPAAAPPAEIWPRVDEALRAVGFRYPRDHRTDALSGGEQQRLALAGVLALRPGLLLLDEQTANLDPAGAAAIRAVVADVLADRRTTLAEITPEGRRVVEKATEAVGAAALGMGDLSEEQLDAITESLRVLRIDAGDFPA